MISMHVSAVLYVRDGFTGRPITQSAAVCSLDGITYRPEYRNGGYLVFVNLAPGEHEVLLRGVYYQDERMVLHVPETGRAEYNVTLKPAKNYPFAVAIVTLAGRVLDNKDPVGGKTVWIAAKAQTEEVKLAQDGAGTGSTSLKVFFRGGEGRRFPGNYLATDGAHSEVLSISGCAEGVAALETPLSFPHKRGVALYPAQSYCTGADGKFLAFFREPVDVDVFDPAHKSVMSFSLKQGRNEIDITAPIGEKEKQHG